MLSPSASRAEPLLSPACQGIPMWITEDNSDPRNKNIFKNKAEQHLFSIANLFLIRVIAWNFCSYVNVNTNNHDPGRTAPFLKVPLLVFANICRHGWEAVTKQTNKYKIDTLKLISRFLTVCTVVPKLSFSFLLLFPFNMHLSGIDLEFCWIATADGAYIHTISW